MSDIRAIVREILLEELARHGGAASPVRREKIRIRNDRDLNAFALKVLDLARDPNALERIRSGRLQFELDGAAVADAPRAAPATTAPTRVFERGLVTEKHVATLERAASIRVGKTVCFTPLAKDEIRRKGIKIERNA